MKLTAILISIVIAGALVFTAADGMINSESGRQIIYTGETDQSSIKVTSRLEEKSAGKDTVEADSRLWDRENTEEVIVVIGNHIDDETLVLGETELDHVDGSTLVYLTDDLQELIQTRGNSPLNLTAEIHISGTPVEKLELVPVN
ncbi:hypothetical protein [Alteribacter natronophilus]|uniref:hypothetical protein n=1 Tax=Alteribacter natronophilus TaxID=2583810 RepID=UPI00110E5207|nr:hypothetical protein [Alteribacter natronophilus]TMW72856.1 hypothetical protein FGB90_00645 [Alteribacter natronophilus]